jgi:nitroreductase
MIFSEMVKKNRSYRVYHEDKQIPTDTLMEFVENARLIPSLLNLQPLKYYIADYDKRDLVFPYLKWASYLTDWDGPKEGERPAAYIIILSDKNILPTVKVDHGIAGQTILLNAVSKDMGGCMIANINKEGLAQSLNIPDNYTIELVIALGFPKEKIVLKEINPGDDMKYYRDSEGTHYVPKRKLTDIVISK